MKTPLSIAALISLLAIAPLGAIPVTMHLDGDRTLNVDFDHATKKGVVWRLNPGDVNTQLTPLAQVSYIDFPPPRAWEEAEKILATGDLEVAVEKFTAIAQNQFALGYPVPGNYASRAITELLNIRRRLLDAAAIADQARVFVREAATLPPDERDLPPAVEAWIALGKEEWDAALEALATIEAADSEISYLRGRALEGRGETVEAIDAYASTYALGIGNRSEMSRDALRRSAQLLDTLDNEARFPELHAQLKLYAELYGAGALWKDAPGHLVKTAATKLDTIQGMIDKPIAVEEETPRVDLAKLPPLDDRDWILTRELDPKIYLVGHPPLTAEGDTAAIGNGWLFGGGEARLASPESISFYQEEFRLRVAFTPKAENGILVNALEDSGGFDLFLLDGELRFSWSRQLNGADRVTFTLGKIILGIENRLSLSITTKNVINAWFNSAKVLEGKRVPDLINFKTALPFSVGGRSNSGFVPADEMPSFTGTIHHLCVGAGVTLKEVGARETEMFGDKQVRFDPPAPPEPDTPPGPASPAEPAPPPYTSPELTYDLTKLPFARNRDYLLPQELDQRIYFLGLPPFTNEGAIETKTGWEFDGADSAMRFKPVSFRNKRIRIRSVFSTEQSDGILIHAEFKNAGLFGVYLVKGELLFAWRHHSSAKVKPKVFKLGKVLHGEANTLNLVVTEKKVVRGWCNGEKLPEGNTVENYILIKQALELSVGGSNGKALVDEELPKFKGTVHFLSIGASSTIGKIAEIEKKKFDGKLIRFSPPPPDPPLEQ